MLGVSVSAIPIRERVAIASPSCFNALSQTIHAFRFSIQVKVLDLALLALLVYFKPGAFCHFGLATVPAPLKLHSSSVAFSFMS